MYLEDVRMISGSDPEHTVSTDRVKYLPVKQTWFLMKPKIRPRRTSSVEREKALDMALSQIERQFGKGTVMRMGDYEQVAIPAI